MTQATEIPTKRLTVFELRYKLSKAVADAETAMANWDSLQAQLRQRHPNDVGKRLAAVRDLMVFAEAREDYKFACERVSLYSDALQGLAAVSTIASTTNVQSPRRQLVGH